MEFDLVHQPEIKGFRGREFSFRVLGGQISRERNNEIPTIFHELAKRIVGKQKKEILFCDVT